MVRTQLYLDENLHRRLRELAARQHRTVSELVREALARAYGSDVKDQRLATLKGIASLWHDRTDIASAERFVRRLRRDTRRATEA